jgi:hypothetical protein
VEEMNNGYVKLHRELMDKPIWRQSIPEHKALLITIMMMVNHAPEEWEWQGKKYRCDPGQTITSIDKLQQMAGKGVTTQNVRGALVRFEKLGFLTNVSTKTGRLITIVNWGEYQANNNVTNKDSNKEVTKNQQRGNKALTPNKNDKNDKNDKNINIPLELEEPLEAFMDMRKKIKAPMTDRAKEMLLKKLNELSDGDIKTSIKILDQSTMNGWKGIFPIKEKRPPQNQFLRMLEEQENEQERYT